MPTTYESTLAAVQARIDALDPDVVGAKRASLQADADEAAQRIAEYRTQQAALTSMNEGRFSHANAAQTLGATAFALFVAISEIVNELDLMAAATQDAA